jgi:hypothetical protein
MESSQYSAILNNEAVLTNAAQFTTAQRAFVAKLIPRTDILDKFSQQELDFLALQAFSEFLTATEDLLGWVAVLRKWDPADDFSLFEQLDKVRVGPDLESDVLEYLTKLDPDGLRGLLQVPSDEQMLAMGLSPEEVAKINESIPAKLDGFLKVAKLRTRDDRGLVKGFNKVKHMLLAIPTDTFQEHQILLPKFGDVTPPGDDSPRRVKIDGARIDTNPDYIRGRVRQTLETQAVLCDVLQFILYARYQQPYVHPQWVHDVYANWRANSDGNSCRFQMQDSSLCRVGPREGERAV